MASAHHILGAVRGLAGRVVETDPLDTASAHDPRHRARFARPVPGHGVPRPDLPGNPIVGPDGRAGPSFEVGDLLSGKIGELGGRHRGEIIG